ncbi:MAG: NADH-quinone oxidoreductase subunit K [Spirochaetales bacterium]|nr:NADH-quinone oxidoreductase subunit K [Spirochaetales bacterium]
MIARALTLAIFVVGLVGLVKKRNLIKKAYALAIMNTSVVILFTLEGASIGEEAPLLSAGRRGGFIVDPVPQALMLTAIVVGVCVSALALALAYRLYVAYGTLNSDELRKRVDHD